LGTVLFERSAVGVRPTQSGEVLYRHARRLLAQAEEAKDEITALEHAQQGRVAVAVTETGALVLAETLGPFAVNHPDVAIAVFEGPVGEVLGRVRAGQADFGLAAVIGSSPFLPL
jgi:DNA-binding transcriptional LysR family regulator